MKALGIIVVIGVLIGGFFLFGKKEVNEVEDLNSTMPAGEENNIPKEDLPVSSGITTGTEEPKAPKQTDEPFSPFKTVTLVSSHVSFDVEEVRVKKGDTVKFVLVNKEGFHDVVIDEFNVSTDKIPAGQSDSFEFVADKTGTFEYYCSVGSHRAQGMFGKLIVE